MTNGAANRQDGLIAASVVTACVLVALTFQRPAVVSASLRMVQIAQVRGADKLSGLRADRNEIPSLI